MSQYELVMRTGPAPGKVFALTKNEVYIGRDINNEIVINDTEISRQHSHLVLTSEGYAIEDMGSTNGTFVNQGRITGQQLLRPGEIIRLGDNVTLLYQMIGADADATVAARGKMPPPRAARPAPPPPPPQASYAGQVPESPPKAGGSGSRNIVLIGVGLLLVVGVCAAIGILWYIDANYMWCNVFGGLIPNCP
jgi:hypothetical protein